MPWPMVHFSVASRLLTNPSSEFLLGSLAPDSIHIRTNERIEKAKTQYELFPNGKSIYTQDVTKFEYLISRNKPETGELLSKLESGKAYELGGLLEQEIYDYRKEKIQFINYLENESLSELSILSMNKLEEFIETTVLGLRRLFIQWDVFSKLEEAAT